MISEGARHPDPVASATGTFTFPLITTEALWPMPDGSLVLVNASNHPGAGGRAPNQKDNTEFIRGTCRRGRRVAESPSVAKKPSKLSRTLETVSEAVTAWTGSSVGIGTAAAIVVIWALSGPIFGYSDTWQLVINTGTTIVTFLMVFLIQRSQNKQSLALQLKLNELVAALQGASNRLIDVEGLSEEDLQVLRKHYRRLAALAKRDTDLGASHSVEEAEHRHQMKHSLHEQAGRERGA